MPLKAIGAVKPSTSSEPLSSPVIVQFASFAASRTIVPRLPASVESIVTMS